MNEWLQDPGLTISIGSFVGAIIIGALTAIFNRKSGGRLQVMETRSDEVSELIATLREKIERLEKEASERERLHRESIHAYELQLAEQKGRITSLESQTAEYRRDADRNTEERVRQVVKIEDLQKSITELRTSANVNAEQLQTVTRELEAVRREKTVLEESLAKRIQEATTPLIAENQQLKTENMHLKRQVYNLNQLLEKKTLPDTDLLIDTSIPADSASEEKSAEDTSPESAGFCA